MLKPGMQRVLGARVTPLGIEVAGLDTDGHALRLPKEGVLRSPASDAELALAEVAAGLGPVALMGLAEGGVSAQVMASVMGWPVVSGFAAADRRLGGLGGPFEAFFHHALVRHLGVQGPVAVLHLGRIARLTWCDPAVVAPEQGCLAFHSGPGTAAMDALAQARLGQPFAPAEALGQPEVSRVERYLGAGWFHRLPPRVIDETLPDLSVSDLATPAALATLAMACTGAVALALEFCPSMPGQMLVAGGGRHNGALMAMLAAGCEVPVVPIDSFGVPGDALPALALAYLAARVALGLPTSGPSTTGVAAPVGGGTLYHP